MIEAYKSNAGSLKIIDLINNLIYFLIFSLIQYNTYLHIYTITMW